MQALLDAISDLLLTGVFDAVWRSRELLCHPATQQLVSELASEFYQGWASARIHATNYKYTQRLQMEYFIPLLH